MKSSRKSTNQFGYTVNLDQEFANSVRERILTLLDRKDGSWTGTMTQLSRAITSGIRRAVPLDWPTNPSILRRVVNTVAYSLRKEGVRVKFERSTDHMRTRLVSFEQN